MRCSAAPARAVTDTHAGCRISATQGRRSLRTQRLCIVRGSSSSSAGWQRGSSGALREAGQPLQEPPQGGPAPQRRGRNARGRCSARPCPLPQCPAGAARRRPAARYGSRPPRGAGPVRGTGGRDSRPEPPPGPALPVPRPRLHSLRFASLRFPSPPACTPRPAPGPATEPQGRLRLRLSRGQRGAAAVSGGGGGAAGGAGAGGSAGRSGLLASAAR